jgi:hypothetical protein
MRLSRLQGLSEDGQASVMSDETKAGAPVDAEAEAPKKVLSPAAQRALAEAEERRRLAQLQEEARPREINGRGGLDPVRYGDWEIKGLTSDF